MEPSVNYTKPIEMTSVPAGSVVAGPGQGTLKAVIDRKLSSKKFLLYTAIATGSILLLMIFVNVYFDIYGLFRSTKSRNLPVYNNERISKFLLAHRYIPENFNTVIVGTSLSANLDVRSINEQRGKFKIYNASVMGANISELKPIAEKCVGGGIKNMIICFSPYMTKDSGVKEVALDRKLVFSALGSRNLYETYLVAFIRKYNLLPGKYPQGQINQLGVNRYESLYQVKDVKNKIAKVIEDNRNESLTIDPTALAEMKDLLQTLKQNEVNVVAYFHPVPYEVYESKQADYDQFASTIRSLMPGVEIADFNGAGYRWFTTDYSNYIDHGHLSDKGKDMIMHDLFQRLEKAN